MPSTQYLFLFTIASPQAFIAQARKTHDLYAGSQIISELTGKSMEAVLQQGNGNSIVFPCTASWSKPNRFLAKVFSDDIQGFGKNIEVAARTRWMQLALDAFQSAGQSLELQIIDETLIPFLSSRSCLEIIKKTSSVAARQIAEFPDIYWAAIVYRDGDEYATKVTELERLLGGVKNVRKFCQLDEQEGSRKCALDGERTALFYRELVYGSGKNRRPNFLSGESRSVRTSLDSGEALSAVSLVKRLYRKKKVRFPSTAEIALMHIIDEHWEAVYRKYFEGEVDYQLFYEENLTEKILENQEIRIKSGYDLEAVVRAIRALTQETRTKYYALLLFDGDNFGTIWSGETLREGASLEAFQQELAKCLHDYAQAVTSYLDSGKGRAVYSGGDDVLGFVNLSHLFVVMRNLRMSFDDVVSRPLAGYMKEGNAITFTAGVTVAHYKAPLGEVLRTARATEQKAKDIPGKNAFGIAVLKRSGEIHKGFLRFSSVYEANGRLEPVDSISLLENVVEELQNESGFSNTFIKSFGLEMRKVMDRNDHVLLSDVATRTELQRLLYRSSKTNRSEKEKAIRDFLKVVDSLRYVSSGISNFLSLLDICDFLRRETIRG